MGWRKTSRRGIILSMLKYDLTVMVGPAGGLKAGEKIEKIITAIGGKAGRMIEMGKKQLAYPIKKLSEALFLSWTVEMDPQLVVQLHKKLIVDKDVVRHILVRVK